MKSDSEVSLDLPIAHWSGGSAEFGILESSLFGEIELPMVSGVPKSELSHYSRIRKCFPTSPFVAVDNKEGC